MYMSVEKKCVFVCDDIDESREYYLVVLIVFIRGWVIHDTFMVISTQLCRSEFMRGHSSISGKLSMSIITGMYSSRDSEQ